MSTLLPQGALFILVGLRKDLRDDPRTIREMEKTLERPVTWEEVCAPIPLPGVLFADHCTALNRNALATRIGAAGVLRDLGRRRTRA